MITKNYYKIMEQDKDLYFVAVKVFLKNKNGELLILKDKFGDWDIPGGRLREMDFKTPLEKVAERKIKEELGDVDFHLKKPAIFMRHEREEILPDGTKEKRRIFAIGYEADYLAGGIDLGGSHEKYQWVNLENFEAEKYFSGGWLKGVKEYQSKTFF